MLFETPELKLLKEAADRRARNADVSDALLGWFEGRSAIEVLDLSAGTGASIRALAPLLAPDQVWTLYCRDAAEEALARDHLTRWAPAYRTTHDGLDLEREGLRLSVTLRVHDVVAAGAKLADPAPSLVVIDDDLMRYPASVIRKLVAILADRRSVMHARLVYDGRLKLQPHHAAGNINQRVQASQLMKMHLCYRHAMHRGLGLRQLLQDCQRFSDARLGQSRLLEESDQLQVTTMRVGGRVFLLRLGVGDLSGLQATARSFFGYQVPTFHQHPR